MTEFAVQNDKTAIKWVHFQLYFCTKSIRSFNDSSVKAKNISHPFINGASRLKMVITRCCTYRSRDKRLTGVFAASIKEEELSDSIDNRSEVGLEKLL